MPELSAPEITLIAIPVLMLAIGFGLALWTISLFPERAATRTVRSAIFVGGALVAFVMPLAMSVWAIALLIVSLFVRPASPAPQPPEGDPHLRPGQLLPINVGRLLLDILGVVSIGALGWLLFHLFGESAKAMRTMLAYAMLYTFPILVPLLAAMGWLSLRFLRRLGQG
ncbi:MAG: hypothetical protein HRU32_04425 [Rhodobacteraceae bacterium]|nr:hypothetical protein [Paracoccaceae bacterium]